MARPTAVPLYLYQMAIYYNKDLVKKYNLQYILDDGFVTIDEIKDLKGKLPKGTYALTYGNLPWAFMSLLYGAGGTLENDMDDLTKDVWHKPMEKLKEAYDAGVIAPMDVDGEQAFGSGKAVFAQLGTWAQGNMSNTLGADKIAEANTHAVQRRQSGELLLPVQLDAVEGSAPLRGEIRSRRRLRQVRVRALDGLV